MLRVEIATQLLRVRSLVLLGVLIGIPVLAVVTHGGHGDETLSALNFAESGLNFMDPVLFGLVVAVIGSTLGGADHDWGTLRYLYVRPVSPRRVITGTWWTLVICSALVVAAFLVAAVLTGAVAFGWHSYHRGGVSVLSTATAAWATLGAGAYLAVCLLSLGSIALALGLLLPRSVEALGISVAFLIGSVMIENVRALHAVAVVLPEHYWMRWTQLFHAGGGSGGLALGVVVQAATVVVAMSIAWVVLHRRDPAA
ncbi:ABC transporter permease [Cellulomonas sp. P24]|uniref:ABC transporter permease n=1 Tax=Cellulomonas sp. P24 TaxID=2885206 RepID=UPI00216B0B22|nr:ABC transporter permease [Cellulomonas sp. P24]MCR6493619.1 ABC transporter permease [Cellulomonas sp. P24]